MRLLGRVDPAALEDLYAAAAVVVTPTRAEGFGLPVLDALGRGVPVVCSDLPVLREVAGDWRSGSSPPTPVVRGGALRARSRGEGEVERGCGQPGRERAQSFSWRAAAEQTSEAYERARRRR